MGFFKKNKDEKLKLEGRETVISSDDLLEGETVDQEQAEEDIETELSIHPDWNLSREDEYSYRFLNLECPPLKPNQVSLSGISLVDLGNRSYRATAFVRNSLDKTINIGKTTLVLQNTNDELLGRKEFDLQEIGDIPARSSVPWHFIFTHKDLFTEDLPHEGWKLAFMLKPSSRKHSLDLAKSWQTSLASEDKKKLEELVDSMTPPKLGEVNFMNLQAKFNENGDLHATMLIRNGSDKNVNLEQIPLHVEDATGDVIAKGGFKLEDFTVKSNTSKPWTFIFPKSMVTKENPDMSKFLVYSPQKKD
jgi:accessory Sec system S-layer assembly protein